MSSPGDALAKAFAAIGVAAFILFTLALGLGTIALAVYVSLAGWTAIVSSGSLFGAAVTLGGAIAFGVALLVTALVQVYFKAIGSDR